MTERTTPYSPDEARVAKFFAEAGIGGGEDPIGSLIASHRYAMAQLAELKRQPPGTAGSRDSDAEMTHVTTRAGIEVHRLRVPGGWIYYGLGRRGRGPGYDLHPTPLTATFVPDAKA